MTTQSKTRLALGSSRFCYFRLLGKVGKDKMKLGELVCLSVPPPDDHGINTHTGRRDTSVLSALSISESIRRHYAFSTRVNCR